jgi:hypothetical protein
MMGYRHKMRGSPRRVALLVPVVIYSYGTVVFSFWELADKKMEFEKSKVRLLSNAYFKGLIPRHH